MKNHNLESYYCCSIWFGYIIINLEEKSYDHNPCITIDGEHYPWFSQPSPDCHNKTMTSTSCAFQAKKGSSRILICHVVAFQLRGSLIIVIWSIYPFSSFSVLKSQNSLFQVILITKASDHRVIFWVWGKGIFFLSILTNNVFVWVHASTY